MPTQPVTKHPTSPTTRAPKQPQDHRPKVGDHLYTFTWDDQTYQLPPAETAVNDIPGKVLRDAFMDGEEGQMRLGFAMLELVEAPGAVEALYEMPAPAMLDHLQAWMETRHNDEAATVGESSRSPS